MSLQEAFEQAAKDIKHIAKRPSDKELLEIYALYKQATCGDNNESRPAMINLKDRAKHDFWAAKKGLSPENAMRAYIALVNEIISAYK